MSRDYVLPRDTMPGAAARHDTCTDSTQPEARPEAATMRTHDTPAAAPHTGHHARRLLGIASIAIAVLCWLIYLLLHLHHGG